MVRVFSFCLYGPANPRYYPGMLENVFLAGKYFPDWKVYIYYAPDVDQTMIDKLSPCSNVVLKPTGITGAKNMIQRFFAIDEPEVEIMLVRDADSRIHWKDRWAIQKFVASSFLAHTIRDNKDHTALMMGGLWGLKKAAGVRVQTEYANYTEDISRGHRCAHDQNFLADAIYPKVLPQLLIHYSQAPVFAGENHAVPFPFTWINDVYCGRVESDYIDMPQPNMSRIYFPSVSVRVHDLPQPIPQSSESKPTFVPSQPTVSPLQFLNKK